MRDLLALSALVGLASAGTVSVDIRKDQLSAQIADMVQIHRRSGNDVFDLQAFNNLTGGGYYADFGIGTPPQKLTFHLDTGSSDTWVNKKGIDFCEYGRPELGLPPSCMKQFDPESSRTFTTTIKNGFKIGYLDGSSATGDYFNDTVTIHNNITIKNQQLGLAKQSESATGLMGLGMSVGVAARQEYPTIIDNLVSQGIIETAAFSLYLDSLTESHGSFLFGGIDTKKYIGDLATLPLVADDIHQSNNVTSYAVELTGLTADGISVPSLKTKAIFDTGATLVLLPGRIVKPIYDKLGVVTIRQIPTPFIDCAAVKKGAKTNFNFEFNGKTISVPLKEMIINSLADHQEIFRALKSQFKNFESVCMFGIANADNYKTQDPDPTSTGASTAEPEYALLGDTFLRSAYVVYDLAGQQLGLAQAYPKSNESNIVTLKANSALPSIKGMDAPPAEKDSASGSTRAHSAIAAAMALVVAAAVAL
ncbi:hypothetical protein PWT90_04107 [Aphanocladium album]|nr:hypothetical protein PWT90_04107 [Aphanocladium album]